MFDKLEALIQRFDEIMNELAEPDVANNQEQSDEGTERSDADRGRL